MEVALLSRPASTAAKVALAPGERLTAEGGAMIAMSADMAVETRVSRQEGRGGLRGIGRGFGRLLGGEGLFLNHFTAGPRGGEIYLAPPLPGDMEVITLDGTVGLNVQHGSFVAHEQGITMRVSWGGLKHLASGERMIWLTFGGAGRLLIDAFGAIYPVRVDGEYVVNTGMIAAFEDSLDFRIKAAGGSLLGAIAGGEGLVCRFAGKGTVWCQTHAARHLGRRLSRYLIPRKR